MSTKSRQQNSIRVHLKSTETIAELCNFTCNGDKEKLIRNCIVAGVTSTKADAGQK